ncbi:transposase, MuDR, MULE transposase domain protein [Tanacetum coccineum]
MVSSFDYNPECDEEQGEVGASVVEIWGVKGCTIIAIIYDFGVTAGEEYKKETEVKVGNIFDNKEALVLAIRLKALDEGYQYLSDRSTLERGSPFESFEKLPYYCYNLERKNQGTVTRIKTDEKGVFKMLFIAIDSYVHALSTPVAYNRCDTLKGSIQGNKSGSCGHGWKQPDCANCFWYMQRRNRHAAIALAIHNEFPLAFHAVCCRHLMMNLSLKRNKTKGLFWKICKAYTPEEFSTEMSNLQDAQPDAYHKLIEVGPKRWSRAHCPLLPVLKLAETYRAMVQEWYFKRQELADNMRSEITDWVANKVNKKRMKSATWLIYGVNHYQYQVLDGRYNREVDFQTRTCQCRKWQQSGIPCGHVIVVTRFTSPPGRKFVDGLVATVDPVELDNFSTNQVKLILTNSLGYDFNSPTFLYLRNPNCSLIPLADAIQDSDMLLTYDGRSTYYGGIAPCTHQWVMTEAMCDSTILSGISAPLSITSHNMMTSNQSSGLEIDNPHDHIPCCSKSTPCSILTWEDLVSKFINEFFPPSRTTNLRNEISNFQQRFDESFHEAWDRYKDLLRACPHHGFTELHQLDTFYNALNPADQDSLNSAAGGNLLERRKSVTSAVIQPMTAILNNFKGGERVEETLTDPELAEYTIKVPPPLVQKAKPTSLKNYVVHKRDPLHPNIPYPSRMHQEKQQEKEG